jgi:hypothetical protein
LPHREPVPGTFVRGLARSTADAAFEAGAVRLSTIAHMNDAAQIAVVANEDEKRREKRLKTKANPKHPGAAKHVGDHTPNPLPDDPTQCGGESGDAGRT